MRAAAVVLWLVLVAVTAWSGASAGGVSCSTWTMADCVADPTPWLHAPANSEQRAALLLYALPLDLVLGNGVEQPWPVGLNATAVTELTALYGVAGLTNGTGAVLYVEAWPMRDDWGQLTWAFARAATEYSPGQALDAWPWLDGAAVGNVTLEYTNAFGPNAFAPATNASDFSAVFDDFLQLNDLYAKPVFGDCVFSFTAAAANSSVLNGADAWLDVSLRQNYAAQFVSGALGADVLCRQLPMPVRLRGVTHSLVLSVTVSADGTATTELCDVRASGFAPAQSMAACEPLGEASAAATDAAAATAAIKQSLLPAAQRNEPQRTVADLLRDWPPDFEQTYEADVAALSGATAAVFPVSGRNETFSRKEACDASNQLFDLVAYLEERYAVLGVHTQRMAFVWRDIPQTNLIARIPGTNANASAFPVLMCDHFDTAFDEDVFAANGSRVSAPGADDNDSATATLLKAAELLSPSANPNARAPAYDIWLLHLTGEEFPGDDLGARQAVGEFLTAKQSVRGIVLMDMIGWRNRTADDRVFQINAGRRAESVALAQLALSVAPVTAPGWQPVLRLEGDPQSYIFNTDGITLSDAGFPVVLINEHLNVYANLNRNGYHTSTDTIALMDFDFAAAVSKTAIATAALLAGAVIP